jgi:hypothetical protein
MRAELITNADKGKDQGEYFYGQIDGWLRKYKKYASSGLANNAKKYYEGLDETLEKSKQDINKIFTAAEEAENEYAKKLEAIAFEVGLYAERVKALRDVLRPPGPAASGLNPFEAPDFEKRLEAAKQKIVENEIQEIIANPDMLESLNLENRDVQGYISFISDKYRGQDMFTAGSPHSISDAERDLLILCYELLHPENAKTMADFLAPVIKDGKYEKDAQNIKYLTYAAEDPYKTILLHYLPEITLAAHEWADTQHYHNEGSGLLYRLFPGLVSSPDGHPYQSVAITLEKANEGGLYDLRGPYIVFFHELGHAMDDMMRKDGVFNRSGSGLQDLLREDVFAKIEQTIRSIDSSDAVVKAVLESFKDGGAPVVIGSPEELVRQQVINEYGTNLTANKTLMGQSEMVTDVLGGYTGNALGSGIKGYAHSNDYWNDPNRDKPQSSEFFAHYFSARITGYEVKDALLNGYFKESAEFLDKELTDIAGSLGK